MTNMNNKKLTIGIVAILVFAIGGWLLFRDDGLEEAPTEEFAGSVVGSWKNVELPSLIREFQEGGVLKDTFGATEAATGTWEMFDGTSAPEVPGTNFDEELVYLKINLTGQDMDSIYFEIVSLTQNELELRYIGQGGNMNFTRVE